MRAVDGDRGVDNKIRYSIQQPRADGLFSIHPDTGLVTVARPLDRESMTTAAYVLSITVTHLPSLSLSLSVYTHTHTKDITSRCTFQAAEIDPVTKKANFEHPNKTAITEVTVMIIDVNDEIPRFRNPEGYVCEIPENAQRNTPVSFLGDARPEVFDFDQGVNGTFQLHIQTDPDMEEYKDMFDVTPAQGINEASFLIRVRNPDLLDYERVTRVNLTLVASEVGFPERNSSVPITVHVRDVNDNTPEFTRSQYEVSVSEDCRVGTTVAWVQALDDDSGNFGSRGVRYVLTKRMLSGLRWDTDTDMQITYMFYPQVHLVGRHAGGPGPPERGDGRDLCATVRGR